jgi:hypothetical protein
MTKLTSPLWALLFSVAAFAETASKDFTWEEIATGTAALEIENTTAKKQTLAVSLSEFGFLALHGRELTNAEAGLPRIDPKPFELAPGAVKRYRLASARRDIEIRPGKYSALLAVLQDGKTLVPQPVTITVPGAQPLGSEELTAAATRLYPFTSDWMADVRLPLAAPIAPGESGLRPGAPLGVLKRDSGPGFAVVQASRAGGHRPSAWLPVAVLGIEHAGLYKGTLTFPGGKTVALSVLAADSVVYPILVIFFGILIGGFAKRWVNVGRALRLFQRDIAALAVTFAAKDEDFRKVAGGSGYDIGADFERKRKDLAGNLGLLRLSVKPLDQTNTEYQKALAGLKSLQTVAEEWPAFASELEALRQNLDTIAARKLTPPAGASAEPAILDGRGLLHGAAMTLAEYADRRAKVQAAGAQSAQWLSLLQRIDISRDLYNDLSRVIPADSPDRNLLDTADPARAFALLWDANDDGALGRVESLVKRGEDTLEVLRKAHHRPAVAPPAAPEVMREMAPAFTPAQERKRIEPFGTFADYTTVFLWGLGAKALADLASLGLDKAVQAITRQQSGGE